MIENVKPEIDCGRFPIKRAVGEVVEVSSDIFCDGHEEISGKLLCRKIDEKRWREVRMVHVGNDRWIGEFAVDSLGTYLYTVEATTEPFDTWRAGLDKKVASGQDIGVDLRVGISEIEKTLELLEEGAPKRQLEGLLREIVRLEKTDIKTAAERALSPKLAELMEAHSPKRFLSRYGKELRVEVDRRKALFSTWYEMFPRSCSSVPGRHGTFKDLELLLPRISRMGFDVLYLPPIHPIGVKNRKGRNNSPLPDTDSPGSPWAIGSSEGGHKAVNPLLGTLEDFQSLIAKAREHGIEIAMDLAFQCSPDHPYINEHPEWFNWRPDGSIHYAENPPKKYEDIVPFNFETEDWQHLWEELKSVVEFWIAKGVRIFRVDNPHTKPFNFWEWLISEIKMGHPDVIFLSEAFTRPKVMYRLAKLGFSQSYTYFTWRNTKQELMSYVDELTHGGVREYLRPNFWPNTPDILPEFLQLGGRNAFIIRLVLAATLSSNYGIYGPPYELCENNAMPGSEEYLNSEKYEIRNWNLDSEEGLGDLITRINRIRKDNPALQDTYNTAFLEINNDKLIAYSKATRDLLNVLIVVVNLDPFHTQSGQITVPTEELGIDPEKPYLVHDLLGEEKYLWQGRLNSIELSPSIMPAYIFRIRKLVRKEANFDYYM